MMAQAMQQKGIIQQAAPLESDDPGKWELDTGPWLDSVYHDLLGEIQNENGVWTRDYKRKRVMNELGASEYIREIKSRVSIHMQFSTFTDEDLKDIASRAAEIYADKLEDNWDKWDIEPTESNLTSIATDLYDILFITLRIAKDGGMKKHREKSKNPYANIPQSDSGGMF